MEPKRLALICLIPLLVAGGGVGCKENEAKPTSVTVPLAGGDVEGAYSTLHAAGLHVVISQPFALSTLVGQEVRLVRPRPGAVVPRGTIAVLRPTVPGPMGSPAVRPHTDRLPDFTGLTAAAATALIEEHDLFWAIERLPGLPPTTEAEHLLDAYVVTAQSPQPGTLLAPGILHANGGGFEVTPVRLTVAFPIDADS